MELDDLKKGWQKKTAEQSKLNNKSMEQLELMLKEKTVGVLHNVKNKYGSMISYLLIGACVTIVVMGFLPWLMGNDGPVYAWSTTLDRALNMLVAMLIIFSFLFFYWARYNAAETVVDGQDLRLALEKSIQKLKRSFKQEVAFVVILFFAWMIIARFHSQVAGHGDFWDIFRIDILVAIAALAALLGIYLVHRFRQYRSYIQELEEYLAEYDKP
jgi:hypothetical protein